MGPLSRLLGRASCCRARAPEPMPLIPPLQRRSLAATLLLGGLLIGLPRAGAAPDSAPVQADRAALAGPQVRVLLREAQALTVRAPAGSRLRLRDGSGQVVMELGPDQLLRLQLDGSQVLGLVEASGAGNAPSPKAPGPSAKAPGPSAAGPSGMSSPTSSVASAATAPSLGYDSATGSAFVRGPGLPALAGARPADFANSSPRPEASSAGGAKAIASAVIASAAVASRSTSAGPQRLRVKELVVEPLPAPGTDGSIWLQKHRYRGTLMIRPQGDGLQAVNLVGLETYLASVVGSEMPASWPLEALRAQAVAARTYALRALRPSSGRAYDLKSTVASQMYLGVEAETASTQAAVAGTRGLVLTFGEGLIEAVFHSSSGGNTENSGDLWAQQLPYLVSVADFDQDSPVRDWRLPLSDDLVRKGFPEIGSLERIEVLSSTSSGRVRQARVVGSVGSLVLTGAELRSRLGLKSTLVQFAREPLGAPLLSAQAWAAPGQLAAIAPGQAPGLTPSTAAAPQGAGPAFAALAAGLATPASIAARGSGAPVASGEPVPSGAKSSLLVVGGLTPGAFASAAPLLAPPPLPAWDGRSAPVRLQWVAIGHGFGHGIGMSQWGALGMARRGEGFEQILQHYYRGTQLRQYTTLAGLAPVLQMRLSLGAITGRPRSLTLGATP